MFQKNESTHMSPFSLCELYILKIASSRQFFVKLYLFSFIVSIPVCARKYVETVEYSLNYEIIL